MGQYHIIVNLDKREFLDPSAFDDGTKVGEFSHAAGGTLTALAMLLYGSAHDGGGFFRLNFKGKARRTMGQAGRVPKCPAGWTRETYVNHVVDVPPVVGRWTGDRVVVVGDYAWKPRWYAEAGLTERDARAWSRRKLADLKKSCSPEDFERRKDYYLPKQAHIYRIAEDTWNNVSADCAAALRALGMLRDPNTPSPMRPDFLVAVAPPSTPGHDRTPQPSEPKAA